MTPAEIAALAATAMRTVNGLIDALEAAQGAPLTDEQREAILEGRQQAEQRWADLAP